MPLEIYFKDLPKRVQNQILKYYGIKSPEQAGFDYVPVFVLRDNDDDKRKAGISGRPTEGADSRKLPNGISPQDPNSC